jgi:hypothetical protein
VLRKAYEATKDGFFSIVTKQWPIKPHIAVVGLCYLVGVICCGMLYVAKECLMHAHIWARIISSVIEDEIERRIGSLLQAF